MGGTLGEAKGGAGVLLDPLAQQEALRMENPISYFCPRMEAQGNGRTEASSNSSARCDYVFDKRLKNGEGPQSAREKSRLVLSSR